jgi:ABC-type proline/glycine betaine transport system ATPase subunit
LVTHEPPSASGEHWRAFDPEAQLLARALRAGRLTVLVGAAGVGKTTLLVAGVLPLLRRRVGDELRQPGGGPRPWRTASLRRPMG